jgi:hypothetical protein
MGLHEQYTEIVQKFLSRFIPISRVDFVLGRAASATALVHNNPAIIVHSNFTHR